MNVPVSAATAKVCDWMGNCQTRSAVNGALKLSVGIAPIYVVGVGL